MDILNQQPDTLTPYRLTGEDSPVWLMMGFGLIGALLASAAAWLWMTGQPGPREPPIQGEDQHRATAITPQPIANPVVEGSIPPVASLPVEQPTVISTVEKPASPADNLPIEQPTVSPKAEEPAPTTLSPQIAEPVLPAASPIPPNLVTIPGETPEVAVGAERLPAIQAEPPSLQPPDVPAAALSTSAVDASDDTADRPTTPISTPWPAKPTDCPPVITIPFKRGSVEPAINPTLQLPLDKLRRWLDDQPRAKISIQGHADSRGSERSNLLISYRRAKAVVALLSKAGIPPERMVILAFGEHDPIEGIPADSDENRRVSAQVKGLENCQAMSTERE
jgi:outer membrane protein OmpA-like peptidoglycan-associated protein